MTKSPSQQLLEGGLPLMAEVIAALTQRVERLEREKANLTADQYARLLLMVGPPEAQPSDDKAPAVEPADYKYGGLCQCAHSRDHSKPHERWCVAYRDPAANNPISLGNVWVGETKPMHRPGAPLCTEPFPCPKPQPQRFTAPEPLPVGKRVRILVLGNDLSPGLRVGAVLTVTDYADGKAGHIDSRGAFDSAGGPCYFAYGPASWIRTVELVEEEPAQPEPLTTHAMLALGAVGDVQLVDVPGSEPRLSFSSEPPQQRCGHCGSVVGPAQPVESEPSGNPESAAESSDLQQAKAWRKVEFDSMLHPSERDRESITDKLDRASKLAVLQKLVDATRDRDDARSELTRLTEENARLTRERDAARETMSNLRDSLATTSRNFSGVALERDTLAARMKELEGVAVVRDEHWSELSLLRLELVRLLGLEQDSDVETLRERSVVAIEKLVDRVKDLGTQLSDEREKVSQMGFAMDSIGKVALAADTSLRSELDAANARAERMDNVVKAVRVYLMALDRGEDGYAFRALRWSLAALDSAGEREETT